MLYDITCLGLYHVRLYKMIKYKMSILSISIKSSNSMKNTERYLIGKYEE